MADDVEMHPVTQLLRALHEAAPDRPSLRALARDVGCAHTTVHQAMTGQFVPSLEMATRIVRALDGDTSVLEQLYTSRYGEAPVIRVTQREILAELRAIRRLLEEHLPGAPT